MTDPVSVEEHQRRVLEAVAPLAPVARPLLDALDLVAAEEVRATVSLPGFDNSGMDGYAVRLADVATATADQPVELPVAGEIGAGQGGPRELAPGTVAKIMTGAPVPAGADAVVPYEWTDRGADRVRIQQAPEPGQHVRPAGEDVRSGDLVVAPGTRLGPRHLGLLASVGCAEVRVHPRPRVAVLSTGSELREPGRPLGHGQIHDGNSYLLAAAVTRAGGEPQRVGIVPDDAQAFLAVLDDRLAGADLVVTSGGVSQGDFDVVKAALRERGVWFGPVAMQPGKPQGFGLLEAPDGRRVPVVTLPGNSVSSYVSFTVFVLPALRRMLGLRPELPPTVTARLTGPLTSPAGRRQFLRGAYADGSVTLVGGPGSHLIGGLAQSDCLVVVPERVTALAEDDEVAVIRLDGAS